MKLKNIISKKFLLFLAPVCFLLLASCGSYEYSGYGNDGIYGDTNRPDEVQSQRAEQPQRAEHPQRVEQDDNKSYYKKLFSEEATLYGDVLAEGAIFTDVETYTSTGNYDPAEDQQTNYQGGNAPWGEDPDEYTINIYNHGYYSGFYNPYWMGGIYAYDPFWGPGYYGHGFYGPGYWRSSWHIGFGGFHGGYGYGYAAHPFIYGSGIWYNPYNFYGNRYHSFRDNVAYNTGRRNATTSYNRSNVNSSVRNGAALNSRGRSSSYSRSIRNLRNSDDGSTRRTYSNARGNSNSQYRSNRTQSDVYRSERTNNTSYSRSSTTSGRTNTGTVRSSTNSSRSSGTVRSSGSSGRSSSGTSSGRSSSSGSRGRGN